MYAQMPSPHRHEPPCRRAARVTMNGGGPSSTVATAAAGWTPRTLTGALLMGDRGAVDLVTACRRPSCRQAARLLSNWIVAPVAVCRGRPVYTPGRRDPADQRHPRPTRTATKMHLRRPWLTATAADGLGLSWRQVDDPGAVVAGRRLSAIDAYLELSPDIRPGRRARRAQDLSETRASLELCATPGRTLPWPVDS